MSHRFLRSCLLISLAVLALAGQRIIYRNDEQAIAMRPVPLSANRAAPSRIGALEFLGAWELRSNNQNFGGFSALASLADGRLLAIGDSGTMAGFDPPSVGSGKPPFISPLPGAFGPDINFRDRDSEGMAYDAISGRFWVSYEGNPAIRRLPATLSRIDGIARPHMLRRWQGNSAGEALARLSDGRFVLLSEAQDRPDGSYEALLFSGDPIESETRIIPFGYHPPTGYKATDAIELPDKRLLVLNRRIAFPNGFSAKLSIVDPAQISPDQSIRGRVIASLAAPLLVDNMEGIAKTDENGRTILWLISDNNFNIWQRTLLMKFALDLPTKKPDANHAAPGFESL
jgi:hypothetical protein